MRKSGEWMTIWDDRILEVIHADEDQVGQVGDLADNELIRISQSSVSRRCKKLAEHGLLRRIGEGVYLLTDRGERYLEGDLDAREDAPDEPLDSTGETSTGNGSESV
ncbi:hypothetical protein ACKVMT_09925 [Halobacteriales archaeon Cl-PHB]